MIPVSYGDGVADRIRQAAGQVDAFIDTVGGGYVRLALELGVAPSRVDTIANFEAVEKYGVKAEGNASGASAAVLAELAGLIAGGELEVPIAATFPAGRGAGRLPAAGAGPRPAARSCCSSEGAWAAGRAWVRPGLGQAWNRVTRVAWPRIGSANGSRKR